MCSALRCCLSVYFDLSPRGIASSWFAIMRWRENASKRAWVPATRPTNSEQVGERDRRDDERADDDHQQFPGLFVQCPRIRPQHPSVPRIIRLRPSRVRARSRRDCGGGAHTPGSRGQGRDRIAGSAADSVRGHGGMTMPVSRQSQRAWVALCGMALALAACSGGEFKLPSFGSADPYKQDPNVFPASYRQEVLVFLRAQLEDPTNVR